MGPLQQELAVALLASFATPAHTVDEQATPEPLRVLPAKHHNKSVDVGKSGNK